MGNRCGVDKVKGIIKRRSLRSKVAKSKSPFKCGTNQKIKHLITWHYLSIFVLLFFCLATPGYALDVTLQWVPNNEPNLAGYQVFYRQEGQSYNYTSPYWETIDNTCTVYDLDETKTYYFVVRAFSTEGFQSSNSNEICLKAGTSTGN